MKKPVIRIAVLAAALIILTLVLFTGAATESKIDHTPYVLPNTTPAPADSAHITTAPLDLKMSSLKDIELYSSEGEFIENVSAGSELCVTGRTDDGWYETEYNGSPAYFSKDNPLMVSFAASGVVIENTCVYDTPDDTGKAAGYLVKDTNVTVTGSMVNSLYTYVNARADNGAVLKGFVNSENIAVLEH